MKGHPKKHKFIVTVITPESRKQAAIALYLAFAMRDPDNCEFYIKPAKKRASK